MSLRRRSENRSMWIVAKINNKEFNTFKNALITKLHITPEVYSPKILIDSLIKKKLHKRKKFILGDYIFLKHEKFSDKRTLNLLKYSRGLDMILPFFETSQNEIINFIKRCKENENKFGYLSQNFFDLILNKNIEFNSGPFTRFVGQLVEIQKNKIKVLVRNYLVTVNSRKTIVV